MAGGNEEEMEKEEEEEEQEEEEKENTESLDIYPILSWFAALFQSLGS